MDTSIITSAELTSRPQHSPQKPSIGDTRRPVIAVTAVVRKQPGGSQSCLVECDDGKLYVLKMHPNPQGPNVLANEAIGSILLRGLGFLAPQWRPVTIDLKAVRFFPDLAMQRANDKSTFPACGLHFGSEYLGGPRYDIYNFNPKSHRHKLRNTTQLLPIYLFDVWANHQDERQCVYQRTRDGSGYTTIFVDNGHLFGGPMWSEVPGRSRAACSANIPPPAIGDPRIEQWLRVLEARIPRLLHHAIAAVPVEWYKDDIYSLYARLLWRLEVIRPLVVQDILRRTLTVGHCAAILGGTTEASPKARRVTLLVG